MGFEAIRWPWILHYTETVDLTNNVFHEFEPIPVVVGEQPVGYLLSVDADDDIRFGASTAVVSDSALAVDPGLLVAGRPLFDPASLTGAVASPVACFTYTLDQFGSLYDPSRPFFLHYCSVGSGSAHQPIFGTRSTTTFRLRA